MGTWSMEGMNHINHSTARPRGVSHPSGRQSSLVPACLIAVSMGVAVLFLRIVG